MAYPTITALPAAPQRTQSPDAFATTADTFVAALPDLVTEVNASGAYIEEKSIYVGNDFQGEYSSGTTYSTGQSVSDGGLYYVSLVDSNTGNTPASSPSQWSELNVILGAGELVKNAGEDLTAGQPVYLNQSGTLSGISTVNVPETFGTLVEGLAPVSKTGFITRYDPISNSFIVIYDVGNTVYLRLLTLEEDGTYTLSSEVTLATNCYSTANEYACSLVYDTEHGNYVFLYLDTAYYPRYTTFTIASDKTVAIGVSSVQIAGTSYRIAILSPFSVAYNETLNEYVAVYSDYNTGDDLVYLVFTINSSGVPTVTVAETAIATTTAAASSNRVVYIPWTGQVWVFYSSGFTARTISSSGMGSATSVAVSEYTSLDFYVDEFKEILTIVSVGYISDHLAALTFSIGTDSLTLLDNKLIMDDSVTTEDFNNFGMVSGVWYLFGLGLYSAVDGQAERYVFVYNGKTGTSYNYLQSTFAVDSNGTITVIETGQDFWMNNGVNPIVREMSLVSEAGKIIFLADTSSNDVLTFTYTPEHTYETNSRFIGLVESAVTSGNSATVNTISGTNVSQTGLITGVSYYVNTSGGLETLPTATNFGPVATAISATEVIVKA